MFKDGQNLHNFVAISFPNNLIKVLDPYLVSRDAKVVIEDGNNENLIPSVEEWSVSLFKIGFVCSMESPKERLNIVDVNRYYALDRDQLFNKTCSEMAVSREVKAFMTRLSAFSQSSTA
ncbi:putative LRR receptor serine/threonine-protein kinase [Trifolium repens]|nr:putative LRR receptor serine/threonine-protein kinase [Trifolium repens]